MQKIHSITITLSNLMVNHNATNIATSNIKYIDKNVFIIIFVDVHNQILTCVSTWETSAITTSLNPFYVILFTGTCHWHTRVPRDRFAFTSNNIQYKIWGCIQLCFYWFQVSISTLPTHINWVKTFQIWLLPLTNLQVYSKCVIVSGIFSWRNFFRVDIFTNHYCFVLFYLTQRSQSVIMFPIVPEIIQALINYLKDT